MSAPKASTTSVLTVEIREATAVLTFNRPDSLNAFDTDLQQQCRDTLDALAEDDAVRCVVLTGAGRAFSAGADIALDDLSPTVRLASRTEEELRLRYNPIIRTIRTMPKPVVAAVNGAAVGVGCALALACDQVLAARSASFAVAFSKVGLTLDAGASLLLGSRIGFGRASRMALLSERIDAETAHSWGMVDEVIDDAALPESALAMATRLSQGPTRAFAATKHSLNVALLAHLDSALEAEVTGQTTLVDSADFREGATAFGHRRSPRFTGR